MLNWLHAHFEVVTVILSVIALAFAWFQLRKKESPPTSGALSFGQSHLENSTIIGGSSNRVVIGSSTLEPRRVEAESPKAELSMPNLVHAGGRRKSIFVSPSQYEGICDPRTQGQREKSVEGFVLKFENRIDGSDRRISRALNVIAKVKFRHKNGVRERDVDYGIWLNASDNSTDIGIGDTCELVLLCVLDNKLLTFEDRRRGNIFFDEGFTYLQEADVEDFEFVDITLVDQNSQTSLKVKLKVWRQGASFFTTQL